MCLNFSRIISSIKNNLKSSNINQSQEDEVKVNGFTVTCNKSYWPECINSFIVSNDASDQNSIKSVFEISEKDDFQQKLSEIGNLDNIHECHFFVFFLVSTGIELPIQVNVYKSYLSVDEKTKIGLTIFLTFTFLTEILKVNNFSYK